MSADWIRAWLRGPGKGLPVSRRGHGGSGIPGKGLSDFAPGHGEKRYAGKGFVTEMRNARR